MIDIGFPHLEEKITINRVIGSYSQGKPGPCFMVFAGLHGNEPSGIIAFLDVLERLQESNSDFNGEIIGVAGNLKALREDVRSINEDLNRFFVPEKITRGDEGAEYEEMKEILSVVKEKEEGRNEPIVFIDCHTTSSSSQPYISVNRKKESLELTLPLPIFTVKGIEDFITGTLDHYLNDKGYAGFTFEAGHHHSLTSVENHEAAIWLTLVEAGCMTKENCPMYNHFYEHLKTNTLDDKKIFDLKYRYKIQHDETFKMKPGYINFQKVYKGESLATSNGREILSEWDARILMPLYQKSGDDGFFIVEEVSV